MLCTGFDDRDLTKTYISRDVQSDLIYYQSVCRLVRKRYMRGWIVDIFLKRRHAAFSKRRHGARQVFPHFCSISTYNTFGVAVTRVPYPKHSFSRIFPHVERSPEGNRGRRFLQVPRPGEGEV